MPNPRDMHTSLYMKRRARLAALVLEDRTVPATLVWTGDVDANWGTNIAGNTNWSLNLVPSSGDDLIFPVAAANHANTNNMTGLFLNNINIGGGDYIIGGNAITLVSLTDASASGGSSDLNLPLTPAGNLIVTVNVAGTSPTLGGVISGAGGLTKVGPGTLRLAGSQANTYTGLTTVSSGTLELAKAGAATAAIAGDLLENGGTAREIFNNEVANGSSVTVQGAGTFDVNNFTDVIGNLTVGTTTSNGGSVTIGTGTLTASGTLTMTGGSIASTGAGKLVLGGNVITNSAAVAATISGNLDLNGSTRTFTLGPGAATPDLNISAVISNGGIQKEGSGTLGLSGVASNTYTQTTFVNDGVLELAKTGGAIAISGTLVIGVVTGVQSVRMFAAEQIANAAQVQVFSAGLLDLNGFAETIGGLQLRSNTSNGAHVTTGAGALILNGDVTLIVNGTGANGAGIAGNLDLGGAVRTMTLPDGTAAIDLDVSAVISNGGLTKAGAGTLRLDGTQSNTYVGTTTVSVGTLELAKIGAGAAAIVGNLLISGGVARQIVSNQFAVSTLIIVQDGAALDLNGLSALVGQLDIGSGGLVTTAGAGVGHLTATGLGLSFDSTLAMKLAGTANSDQLTINGTVQAHSALSLNATQALAIGTVITLIDNDGTDAIVGTFAGLPQGATILAGGQLFAISYIGGTGNDVVVTRTGGPTVLNTQVNDGSAQRSRVTSLTVTFSAQVTFAGSVPAAFTLTRTGGGAVTFGTFTTVVNGVTVVTLNSFIGSETGFGSLNDGRYTLTALAGQIGFGGQALDGNGDGAAGDNYTFGEAQGLFRFFGDFNGDRHVDVADFGLFSSTFNLSTGQTGFLAAFDFNGDGHIDIADFGQFSLRFFTILP